MRYGLRAKPILILPILLKYQVLLLNVEVRTNTDTVIHGRTQHIFSYHRL